MFKSSWELIPYYRGFKGNFLSSYVMTLWFCLSLLLDVHLDDDDDGSIKWNGTEVWASEFACNWRVLYMENLTGKMISNASISVGNRNAPTFGLILTISTWLRIFKLTTGSCDVRYAIGTNYYEDKE